MAVIELKNVQKEFPLERMKEFTLKERFVNIGRKKTGEKTVALRDINLTIEKGECFGILGKNGSGKTTLLKIIGGMLEPDKGVVNVNGKIVPILTLGLGFQRELTANENVYLYASILGLKKKEIDEKYGRIVEFSELENVMDVKLKDFSSGMVMRLSFSIAFHVDADIILIDETMSVGDAAFQTKCLEKIKQLKEEGKTIVIVMHSTAEIRRFCDRALILKNGEIVFSGDSSIVCDKYEETIESERLRRLNEGVMKESGIEFEAFCDEAFILKTGEKCTMKIKIDPLPKMVELFFSGSDLVRVFSKSSNDGKIIFQTNSLPITQGKYDVWVRHNGEILSKRPFEVLVKYSRDSEENRNFMLLSSKLPFKDLTISFGENAELEAEMFEKGKTVFVFKNFDKVGDGNKNACLFGENKILLVDKGEEVLNEFKTRVWRKLAIIYFKDILSNTHFEKLIMGVS